MNLRVTHVVLLALVCAQATLTASTSYSFGSTNQITFDSAGASPTYTRGVWTENFTGTNTTTTEQIVCVVGLTVANETDTCGSPGPGTAQSISITKGGQPGNSVILPSGTTNYAEVDGDPNYGAPISTQMTGLTINATYQVSFFEASNEEDGNNKVYSDNWLVYVIPGTTGSYICLSTVCNSNSPGFPAVNPPVGATLAFTSSTMSNPGASSTPWVQQTFTFQATAATEVLEFVTQAVGSAGFAPPFFDLAAVTTSQVTPEPGTWVLMLLGSGLLFAGYRLRRRSSPAYKRVLNAPVSTKV
jgi:hypothetical protein